jgi:NAD(P)-dependent dehydrogenase (short-subunit alcohol dehydrogenase family)
MDIKGHAAIVTGGASGLGAATARMLAQAGAKVAIFDVNQKAAAEVAIDINGIAITCDVTSAAATEAAFAKAAADHGTPRMQNLEPLQDGERGIIVCTASVAAYEGQIGQAAYAASKGGVVALVMPAAREFAQFGIRVNAVAPGIFATPMLHALPEAAQQSLAASVPFPKLLGQPSQYAALVRHMIENRYLNGEVVRLDGALRMGPR